MGQGVIDGINGKKPGVDAAIASLSKPMGPVGPGVQSGPGGSAGPMGPMGPTSNDFNFSNGPLIPMSWMASLNQHEDPTGAGPWGSGWGAPSASNIVPMFGLSELGGGGIPGSSLGPSTMATNNQQGFSSVTEGIAALNRSITAILSPEQIQQYVKAGDPLAFFRAIAPQYAGGTPANNEQFAQQVASGVGNSPSLPFTLPNGPVALAAQDRVVRVQIVNPDPISVNTGLTAGTLGAVSGNGMFAAQQARPLGI